MGRMRQGDQGGSCFGSPGSNDEPGLRQWWDKESGRNSGKSPEVESAGWDTLVPSPRVGYTGGARVVCGVHSVICFLLDPPNPPPRMLLDLHIP